MSRVRARSQKPAAVFAALGCVTRLELISRLRDGRDYSITELTDGLDHTRQAITKHLRVLQDAGIINGRRVGRERRFTIRPDPIKQASEYLKRVSNQWDNSIARLRATVER
ncbi:MAG TPA: metalloregulator ArsR/SmtB family transcription factor [Woeseiaceae bacterium]|nr:metalloregulator ArsR/SmtB family transcription factor [Woeseiaceae bacterium]